MATKPNYIDTTIKVIVDVIAKITKQPSPTGTVHPTQHVTKDDTKASKEKQTPWAKESANARTEDLKKAADDGIKKATGFLHNLWNKLEEYADTAIKQTSEWVKQANKWLKKWQKFVKENSEMVMEEEKKLESWAKQTAKKVDLDEISNDSDEDK